MSRAKEPEEVPRKVCSGEGCKQSYPDNLKGRVGAWDAGWYLQKHSGPAWCPNDTPEWAKTFVKLVRK